ncbi:LptF/LptG family permease, partial [Microbacteriaceae bacterium K1510]|nr:LptF/LptG family permease [Microbacteriaceae bacterium K1510]
QLNVVTSQGQDVWMLIKMTTLALPNLMAIIAPFSLLIASTHTLNRLNGDSELIVLTASGATVWRAAKPLLLLAVLVAIGVGFVNHVA